MKKSERKRTVASQNPSKWHFSAENNFESDVFGSYTGAPLTPERRRDEEDLFPTRDSDDL